MTRTLIVLSLVTALCLAGCSAQSTPPSQSLTEERTQQLVDSPRVTEVAKNEARQNDLRQRVRLWQLQLEKYRDCNSHAANGIAFHPGDPLALATAARGMCSHDELELQTALVATYADMPGVGEDALQHARQTILEHNTAEIVAARSMAQPH